MSQHLSSRRLGLFSLIIIVFQFNLACAAANFEITPTQGTSLPKEVLAGSSVSAFYTITNNTTTIRNGYQIVGLPINVVQNQNPSKLNNPCQNPINLNPKESCVVQLDITGAVNTKITLCKGMSCTQSTTPLQVDLNTKRCDPNLGPMQIISDKVETVYDYQTSPCGITDGDYSDNPVRPFIVGDNQTVLWFASNSKGYLKSIGLPKGPGVKDSLAKLIRFEESGQCVPWLTSRFNSPPSVNYPIESYNNEVWMVAPYTTDGQTIQAMVHNEYHIEPGDTTNVYGNLVAASSIDSGNSFQFYQEASPAHYNVPVIVSPYPFPLPFDSAGKGGMFAQSNIIKWGDYYYMLVESYLTAFKPDTHAGVCIYRTANIEDPTSWLGYDGTGYTIPRVPSYPDALANPEQYVCYNVLPNFYRFSWSYNVELNKFIIIGLNTSFQQTNGNTIEAVIYTLASLDPQTGKLTPTVMSGNQPKAYFLKEITWTDVWKQLGNVDGQAYPSLLDPESPFISNHYGPHLINDDRNFQYSGKNPYLYYTYLYPQSQNHGRDRDVRREALQVNNCIAN